MTRVLLVTGKGGVGKTTIAAATAVRAARAGQRVLLTSTDPAHSLADVLDVELGDEARQVEPRLLAQQLDAQARLEAHWREVRDFLVEVLHASGLGEVQAEELMLLPGLDELFALIDLRAQVATGDHDVIVVDCAPTAETLRLLALPDALGWYVNRITGSGRGLARAVAPMARAVGGFPMPAPGVLGAVERLQRDLADVHMLLQDGTRSTIRLVTNPERVALDETVRTRTSLALFGYAVDAIIVNRVLPDAVTDPYLATWKQRHAEHLAMARATFAPVPVLVSHLHDDEPIGADRLAVVAEGCFGELDATSILHDDPGMRLAATDDGWVMTMSLPFASRDGLDLARRGGDLHVRVDGAHRTVPLPARLRRCDVAGASMRDGLLEVRFVDRPAAAAS